MSYPSSRSLPVRLVHSKTRAYDFEILPPGVAKTVGSLGHEIVKLEHAAIVLEARYKNGSLAAAVTDFLQTRLPAGLPESTQPDPPTLRVSIDGQTVRLVNAPEGGFSSLEPTLLALFHLPALRGFWQRELRRSHFRRLRRVLPKAWFVTADPPAGAVVADLGITSWDRLANADDFVRVHVGGADIAIEKINPPTAPVTLTYARVSADAA